MKSIPGAVVRRACALALVSVVAVSPGASAESADGDHPIDLRGTPTRTSTDSGKPVMLEAGLWSFTMEKGESLSQQFGYRRTEDDTSVHVSVTGTPEESNETLKVEAFAEDGTSCGSETTSANSQDPWLAIGVDLEVGPAEYGDRNSVCLTSDVIRFVVGPTSTPRASESDFPLTIKLVEESPVDDDTDELPSVPETDPTFKAPAAGADQGQVTGSASFDDAPLLEPGSWTSTVREGQQLLYRVHLEWGQTLAAQLDVVPFTEAELEDMGSSPPALEVWFYNPLRRDLGSWFDDTTTSGRTGDEALRLTSGVGPMRYLNRYDDKSVFLPGDYYVSVHAETPYSERRAVEVPFTLTVEPQGEIRGVPDYLDAEPFLVGDGKRSRVASGNPPPKAEGGSWFGAKHVSGLGLGVFGLLCLGLGAAQLRRRTP